MNNTETKTVKIVPKQPRFISDILNLPDRIDEEMELELNVREIVRCMQYADVYENDVLLTPFDIGGAQLIPSTGSTSSGGSEEEAGDDDTWNDLEDLMPDDESTETDDENTTTEDETEDPEQTEESGEQETP